MPWCSGEVLILIISFHLGQYLLAVRSCFNFDWKLFFKDTHVNGNCFKSDAPECCFNWHAETEFLFLKTSWHLVRLVRGNHFSMYSFVMTRFSHAFSCACCTGFRSFWQGTCFNGYHLKCDVLGCCLHWHEEWLIDVAFIALRNNLVALLETLYTWNLPF